MGIGEIAGDLWRNVEEVGETLTAPFSDPVIRLGVTGLSRAGKTVFITSLVANLLDRGRMPALQSGSAITTAYLQPQPDDTVPRFDYETHRAALTAPEPFWPESTRAVSQLRLSLRVQRQGMLGAMSGPRTVHLDIVDYPGEWLLDLGLLDQSFAEWSEETLARIENRTEAAEFLKQLDGAEPAANFEESLAKVLASSFTGYLHAAREAGFYDCTPGRFLLPGEMEGSPVLTFAPLRMTGKAAKGSLQAEMERRFEAYKSRVVKPFFRDHFARIDRQVVLVDALGAIHSGPAALEDLRGAMARILSAFRPGRNAWLTTLLRGKRVEKILFAASKADHLHHLQHPQLTAVLEALLREAKDRADFSGAATKAMSIAALRATVEETISHKGEDVNCVSGILLDSGKRAAMYPGTLPEDPNQLLSAARSGADAWLEADYNLMRFAPAPLHLKRGDGLPHIRLDKAVQFLIGDRLS
ncbi:YcjX family GTP-binding protein [Actibacterium pelagium]|uniref:YcjX family protein n=1 Tax=Actibacterium pelagium TaxID=2029103 RepID=A0A917EMG2_9RHOB|nr:YcjX family protein [Actibacterium pelagium]GGE60505.1 hypothetical protein GCM10011517_30060 [Actibacterium pelagium]